MNAPCNDVKHVKLNPKKMWTKNKEVVKRSNQFLYHLPLTKNHNEQFLIPLQWNCCVLRWSSLIRAAKASTLCGEGSEESFSLSYHCMSWVQHSAHEYIAVMCTRVELHEWCMLHGWEIFFSFKFSFPYTIVVAYVDRSTKFHLGCLDAIKFCTVSNL